MAPSVQQIIGFLNAAKGSTMSFSLSPNTLRHLVSNADNEVARVLQEALSKAKNPTVEVAGKASKRGYTIAGLIVKDGERQLGRGAVSVTGFGQPDAVWKTKFSLLDGNVQASGSQYLGRSGDIDNIAYNIAQRNGVFTMHGIGNGSKAHIRANTKEIVDSFGGAGTWNSFIGKINQKIARLHRDLRLWTMGEKSTPSYKVTKDCFSKIEKVETPILKDVDKLNKLKTRDTSDLAQIKKQTQELAEAIKAADIKRMNTPEFQKKELASFIKEAERLGIDVSKYVKKG